MGRNHYMRIMTLPNLRLSIRLDFANGDRIGPGKNALLEAIRAKGSISVAALHLGMSYRRHGSLGDAGLTLSNGSIRTWFRLDRQRCAVRMASLSLDFLNR
jgi:hypothetical protein